MTRLQRDWWVLLMALGLLLPLHAWAATAPCTLWSSEASGLISCLNDTFPTTCAVGVTQMGIDPADGVLKSCQGGATGGTFAPVPRQHVTATTCPTTTTTARQGELCLSLDTGAIDVCATPSDGGDTNLCDSTGEWQAASGGVSSVVNATGRLLYYPTSESTAFKICEDDTEANCFLFYIHPSNGLTMIGKCSGTVGDCDSVIQVQSGKQFDLKYGTDSLLSMAAGSNDLRVTANGWLTPRAGTGTPTSTDCDAAGEAGRVYIQSDASDASMQWVCKGTSGWKQQTGGAGVTAKTYRGFEMVADGTNCVAGAPQINSGQIMDTITCADNDSGVIYGALQMSEIGGCPASTLNMTLYVTHGTTETITFAGDFQAMYRRPGQTDVLNNTYSSTDANSDADPAITTAYEIESATASVTPNGTCAADAWLLWKYTISATRMSTNAANSRIIGVKIAQP